jgi:hypothetical protein
MSTLTIILPEERMIELQHIASRLGSSPEKLVEASINELLQQAKPNIHRAIAYVLKRKSKHPQSNEKTSHSLVRF